MQKVQGFLADVFSWQNALTDLVRAGIFTAITWLFMFAVGASPKDQRVFWSAVPVAALVLISMLRALLRPSNRFRVRFGIDVFVEEHVPHFAVMAAVSNTGPPSVVTEWDLTVDMGEPNGKVKAELMPLQTPREIPGKGKEKTMVVAPHHCLFFRTLQWPIASGSAAHGVLLFKLPGIAAEAAHRVGTKITLSCADVDGRVYSSTELFTGKGFERMFPPPPEPIPFPAPPTVSSGN